MANSTYYLEYYISWASLALLYYDYALTFGQEVRYIWGSKLCLSNVVYIGCRYALVANVLYLLATSDKLTLGCDTWYKVIAILAVLGRASIIVAFTARTYAVYGQNHYVLAYLAALGLATVITDTMHVPGQKCYDSTKTPIVSLLRSLLTIVFETSAALLITIRTIKAFKAYGPLGTKKSNILYLIFEEGLMYFCIISIFTVATFILKLRAPPGFFQDMLNAFTLPLSGILTARFILHLKAWKEKESFKMTGRDEEGNDYHPHVHFEPQPSYLPQPPPATLRIDSYNEVSTLTGDTSSRRHSHVSPSSPRSVSDSSTLVPSSPWIHQDSEFGNEPMASMAKTENLQKGSSGAGSSFWMDESSIEAPVTIGGRRGSEGQRSEGRFSPLRRDSTAIRWA